MAFTFTPEQRQEIARLRAEKAKWERVISNANARLTEANAKLDAVAVLNGGTLDVQADQGDVWGVKAAAAVASEADAGNMTGAIEYIAAITKGTPIFHRQMKQRLREMGFPEERLGNYYYTAIHRLKHKNRIHIGENGQISAVQP